MQPTLDQPPAPVCPLVAPPAPTPGELNAAVLWALDHDLEALLEYRVARHGGHPRTSHDDARRQLYAHYLCTVERCRPLLAGHCASPRHREPIDGTASRTSNPMVPEPSRENTRTG